MGEEGGHLDVKMSAAVARMGRLVRSRDPIDERVAAGEGGVFRPALALGHQVLTFGVVPKLIQLECEREHGKRVQKGGLQTAGCRFPSSWTRPPASCSRVWATWVRGLQQDVATWVSEGCRECSGSKVQDFPCRVAGRSAPGGGGGYPGWWPSGSGDAG